MGKKTGENAYSCGKSALIAKISQSNDFRVINKGVTSQQTNEREKRRRSEHRSYFRKVQKLRRFK